MTANSLDSLLAPTGAATQGWRLTSLDDRWLERMMAIEHRCYTHPWTKGNFEDSLASGYWIAGLIADDCLDAYMVVMPGVDEAHLLNIAVAPDAQGQGLARLLLECLFDWARAKGHHWVWLEVRASNTHAHAIYNHLGFVQVGRRPNYYPARVTPANTSGREDALVMSYRL